MDLNFAAAGPAVSESTGKRKRGLPDVATNILNSVFHKMHTHSSVSKCTNSFGLQIIWLRLPASSKTGAMETYCLRIRMLCWSESMQFQNAESTQPNNYLTGSVLAPIRKWIPNLLTPKAVAAAKNRKNQPRRKTVLNRWQSFVSLDHAIVFSAWRQSLITSCL